MTTMRLATILLLTALIPSLDKRRKNRTSSGPLFYAAYANISPSISSRGSRFNHHKRNKQRSPDASSSSDGLLTLGDLESMQQSNNSGGTVIPTDAILFGQQERQNHANNEEMESSSSHHHQIRRSLRRINLDLSGRVMCHVISPAKQNDDDDDDDKSGSRTAVEMSSSSSMPLFQIHDDATTTSSSRFGSNNNKKLLRTRLRRHFIPHIYIGANYDLDEVWYGATRWIAKCSWQLPKITTTDGSGSRARQFVESIFFPTTKTVTTTTKRLPWMLDLEREQGVFDQPDSTMRVSLVQHHCHPVIQRHDDDSNHQSHHHHHHYHPSTVQKLSVEYDSAKYSNNHPTDNASLLLALAPTISVNIQTPILHPRIELRTKKTWIVQTGGDKHGNYYGGAHYGSYSSPVERRFETIRDGYRGMVPRSQCNTNSINSSSSSSSSTTTTTTTSTIRVGKLQTYGRKLSNWLEEDGWMPKRVTTDLMGNFVSVNEVGFCCSEDNSIIIDGGGNNNEREEDSPPPTTTRKTTTSCRTFLPPINNMGIRLRLSKRIDWTSLGIFPWSSNNNNTNSSSNNRMMHSNQKNTPTRVQFDLCGLHKSGNSVSQIGCEFDPLHLGDTFKVVIGHDDVGAVG